MAVSRVAVLGTGTTRRAADAGCTHGRPASLFQPRANGGRTPRVASGSHWATRSPVATSSSPAVSGRRPALLKWNCVEVSTIVTSHGTSYRVTQEN